MNWTRFWRWYLCRGRVDPRTFWVNYVVAVLAVLIACGLLDMALGLTFIHPPDGGFAFSTSNGPIGLTATVASLVPVFSAEVARLHDRGHSAWWMCFLLLPVAGSIILLVQWCQRGEPGSNQYGPPPGSPIGVGGGQ